MPKARTRRPIAPRASPTRRSNWGFDPATGLMTGKSYNDGKGVDYKYNPAGQLKTLSEPGSGSGASSLSESFSYNAAGLQSGYIASDPGAADPNARATASTINQFDDQGRAMVTMSLDNGQFASDTNTYTALGQPLNESFGAAGNTTVAHGYYPLIPAQGDPTAPIQSPDALASRKTRGQVQFS